MLTRILHTPLSYNKVHVEYRKVRKGQASTYAWIVDLSLAAACLVEAD